MEEELVKLMQQNTKDLPKGVSIRKRPNKISMSSFNENLIGIGEHLPNSAITFQDGESAHAKKLEIDTTRQLNIGFHTDEETQDQFKEYIKNATGFESLASTSYYFTLNGEYRKASHVPPGFSITDRKLIEPASESNMYFKTYESKMTAEDFELADVALHALIGRLSPQEEKPAE